MEFIFSLIKKMALKWKSEFLFISPWLLIASSESERREESHETEKERSFTGFMLKPEWDFDLNTWWYQRAHPKILMITKTSSVGLRENRLKNVILTHVLLTKVYRNSEIGHWNFSTQYGTLKSLEVFAYSQKFSLLKKIFKQIIFWKIKFLSTRI